MMNKFKSFVANESGATAIEYALIASLIAIALVTILGQPRHQAVGRVLGSQLRPQVSAGRSKRAHAVR